MTPPDINRNEAAAALDTIQQVVAHTRRAVVAAHTADHLIVWGLAWMLGFGAVQFTDWNPGLIWLPVGLVGGLASAWIGMRAGRRVTSPVSGRILLFLVVLMLFSAAWLWILHPFNQRNVGVYVATVFMFSYVAGGLWFGRFFVVLGVGVTVLALAGVRLVPEWLDLIMGLGGGGALTASGLYIRKNWQPRGGA